MSADDDVKMEEVQKYTMVPCMNRLPYLSQEAAQEIRQRVGPIRVEQIRREILDESNFETAHIREEIGPAHLEALRRIMEQDMKMNED
jgi:hypothetical protein